MARAGVNNLLRHSVKNLQDPGCINLTAGGNICNDIVCDDLVVNGLSCFNNGLIFNTTLDVLISNVLARLHANFTIKISNSSDDLCTNTTISIVICLGFDYDDNCYPATVVIAVCDVTDLPTTHAIVTAACNTACVRRCTTLGLHDTVCNAACVCSHTDPNGVLAAIVNNAGFK